MKTTILSRLCVRALLISAVLAVFASAPGQTAPAVLKIAPLKFHQRTLANGLAVLSIENHQSPTVAIQVW